ADLMALGRKGEILIVEVKSSVEDFRTDGKWHEYRPYCDAFAFAVGPEFPREILPEESGLIVADGFGGAVLREAPSVPLAGAPQGVDGRLRTAGRHARGGRRGNGAGVRGLQKVTDRIQPTSRPAASLTGCAQGNLSPLP